MILRNQINDIFDAKSSLRLYNRKICKQNALLHQCVMSSLLELQLLDMWPVWRM